MTEAFSRLQAAVAFAARAHDGQRRKDGKTPYVSHPFRVCLVVREIFGIDDPDVLATALLHDTIEDTTTDYDDLRDAFGDQIADWVAALSKDTRLPDETREPDYVRALVAAPWQVHVCKLADIYDNLGDGVGMSAERQAKTITRSRFYLDALQTRPLPETRAALLRVNELLAEKVSGRN